jgi:hypothetical protein
MNDTPPVYTVKSLKTFEGREGIGFNSTLCRDGKPVARVDDDASGGMLRFHWLDYASPKVPFTVTPSLSLDSKPVTLNGTPEQSRLQAHIDTLPASDRYGISLREDMDSFVDDLVNDTLARTDIRRILNAAFKIKVAALRGDDLITFKISPTDANVAKVKKQHPDVEILNPPESLKADKKAWAAAVEVAVEKRLMMEKRKSSAEARALFGNAQEAGANAVEKEPVSATPAAPPSRRRAGP